MEITTRLGIICPNCNKELEAKTEGLFGGMFTTQPFIHGIIKRVKKEGAQITCGHCNHEWNYVPCTKKQLDNFINNLAKEIG